MAPGADLATHLLQHGVYEPHLETLSAIDDDASARLRKFVKDESIDMLVMGAFVHSRFRQAILGGVTRSLLDDVPVPLFMPWCLRRMADQPKWSFRAGRMPILRKSTASNLSGLSLDVQAI
ncbi:universal stress protein [Nitratireductor luteus]|uniref:universal stress protein n=1 Tax=Nitratireductor luteus TaxID=2976980 RepID=UPI002240BDB0|nr:universal stress protein [Nitratireductor luteus]